MVGLALEKQVDFHDIEILEFNYRLGDNPSVTAGAPIALGDELVRQSKVMVDHYELQRGKRKSRKKLVMTVPERAQILLQEGYTIEHLAEATINAERSRLERHQSNTAQKWDKVNEISERFGRVLRKAMGSGGPGVKTTVAANSA